MANPYGGHDQTQHYQQYGAPQNSYGGHGQPPQGYAQDPQQYAQPSAPVGDLTAQMGNMNVAGTTRRKKERHAYHDLQQPPSAHPQPAETASHFVSNAQGTPAQPAKMFVNPADQLRMGEEMVTAQGRVDPEQIPSVARARDAATQQYQTQTYPTMEKHLPPPAAIPFVAHDQGNSSPKYARLTINSIPSTAEALASTGLPLGLVMQPFAAPQEGEQSVPCLDFGEAGPPRCRRCRTYINPFMTFRAGGSKMVCNMCSFPNDVAPEYFAPTDPSGIRVDRAQRPELMLGTCEYLVPKEYWAKEPVGLRWLFLLDVSTDAIAHGCLSTVCQGILKGLYGDNSEEESTEEDQRKLPTGTRVGFVTYDREIQFYNLNPELASPQMMVMTDLEDPFVPISTGLFVDPAESEDLIKSLLESLPTMFPHPNPEPALLPTLNAALEALKQTGGKIICTLSALPTYGPGKLKVRDASNHPDSDLERKFFTIEDAAWKKTAQSMVTAGVGVDFFILKPSTPTSGMYMDIATIGHVSRLTGGEMFFYPNFMSPRDSAKAQFELDHAFRRETGYQALMKVRCSNGLQVASYHGSFLQHSFGADLEIGTMDADKAIGVIFSYDGKLDPKLDAHFQAALLYTSADGQRRVRCINVVAGVNEGAAETMRTVDQDAVINIIAKEASSKITEKSLKDIRNGITEKTINVLAAYRKNFSGSHPPGQLVLPEHLRDLSIYMLGLIKSRAFKGMYHFICMSSALT
jgi:protein transport protein SEC24